MSRRNKFEISENYIMSIIYFMNNYILEDKDKVSDFKKYSFEDIKKYLCDKGYKFPCRTHFSKIKNEGVLRGTILLVRDATGKIIPYYNPRYFYVSNLLEELKNIDSKSHETRKKVLK